MGDNNYKMKSEAIIGLLAFIAMATLAIYSVDVSLAAEEPKVEHIGFKSLVLNITELERTNGEVTAVLFNVSIPVDNPNPISVIGDIDFDVKETDTKTFLAESVRVELLPNESSVISLEEVITDTNIIKHLTKGNLTLVVFWEIHTLTEDEGWQWTGAERIEVYNEGSGVWLIPISVTPRPIFQSVEEIKSPEPVTFKNIFVKITELERIDGEVTAVFLNMSIIIDNPNPVTVYMNYDFDVHEVETSIFLTEDRVLVELLPYGSSVISLEGVITDRNVVAHLTEEYQRIFLSWYSRRYATGKEWTHPGGWGMGSESIEVYNGSGVWPLPTSVPIKEPKIPEHVHIKKIEVNIDGEDSPVFFYMNVSIYNPNPVMVKELIKFEVKEEETTNFLTRWATVELPPNESSVISLEALIKDEKICAHITKANPIIWVSWDITMRESGEGWTIKGGTAGAWREIQVHKGSGSWPTPSSVYVAKIPEALQERPETILAVAGLVVVAYMLLQPKRKKNLKIRTAARLGLLCVVLNFFSLGILNPFYFIFIVAAILVYSCLLLKQKWSATLVMFVYSIIGAAIMVFFYLLFDVTFEWDYLYLARFAANALFLLPAEGIVGFIITILFGVSIGIIADVVAAFLKSNEAHATVVIGLVIAFVMFFFFIGMAFSVPGGLEGPVFIILFPMIACGAIGGYLGYLIFDRRRNTEGVLKIQGS